MKIALCTLVLNEMEWLPKLYEQHKDWPDLVEWVFVESADKTYSLINQKLVTPSGLSVDGTSEYLRELANKDSRIKYIPYGFSSNTDIALGKIESRQVYLNQLRDVKPDFLLILDADEFYTFADQYLINQIFKSSEKTTRHYCFPFTHIWHPKSILDKPLFTYEVCGGFWGIRHTKGIRWHEELTYTTNHQRPSCLNYSDDMRLFSAPYCIHMAFASDHKFRKAKHEYYKARGEAADRRRKWYCESRAAFETWTPGMRLPREAEIRIYTGNIPECFKEDNE